MTYNHKKPIKTLICSQRKILQQMYEAFKAITNTQTDTTENDCNDVLLIQTCNPFEKIVILNLTEC